MNRGLIEVDSAKANDIHRRLLPRFMNRGLIEVTASVAAGVAAVQDFPDS